MNTEHNAGRSWWRRFIAWLVASGAPSESVIEPELSAEVFIRRDRK